MLFPVSGSRSLLSRMVASLTHPPSPGASRAARGSLQLCVCWTFVQSPEWTYNSCLCREGSGAAGTTDLVNLATIIQEVCGRAANKIQTFCLLGLCLHNNTALPLGIWACCLIGMSYSASLLKGKEPRFHSLEKKTPPTSENPIDSCNYCHAWTAFSPFVIFTTSSPYGKGLILMKIVMVPETPPRQCWFTSTKDVAQCFWPDFPAGSQSHPCLLHPEGWGSQVTITLLSFTWPTQGTAISVQTRKTQALSL